MTKDAKRPIKKTEREKELERDLEAERHRVDKLLEIIEDKEKGIKYYYKWLNNQAIFEDYAETTCFEMKKEFLNVFQLSETERR